VPLPRVLPIGIAYRRAYDNLKDEEVSLDIFSVVRPRHYLRVVQHLVQGFGVGVPGLGSRVWG
jgi:hypothetical protein